MQRDREQLAAERAQHERLLRDGGGQGLPMANEPQEHHRCRLAACPSAAQLQRERQRSEAAGAAVTQVQDQMNQQSLRQGEEVRRLREVANQTVFHLTSDLAHVAHLKERLECETLVLRERLARQRVQEVHAKTPPPRHPTEYSPSSDRPSPPAKPDHRGSWAWLTPEQYDELLRKQAEQAYRRGLAKLARHKVTAAQRNRDGQAEMAALEVELRCCYCLLSGPLPLPPPPPPLPPLALRALCNRACRPTNPTAACSENTGWNAGA